MNDAQRVVNECRKDWEQWLSLPWPGFVERYFSGEYFVHGHVGYPKGSGRDQCAMLERRDGNLDLSSREGSGLVNACSQNCEVKSTVLVEIPKLIQLPKRVRRVVGAEGLEILDDSCNPRIDALDHSSSTVLVITFFGEDGEASCAFRRSLPVERDRLPDSVIERRPGVVDDFTREKAPTNTEARRKVNPHLTPLRLNIEPSSHAITLMSPRCLDAHSERIEVLLGPSYLGPAFIEIVNHELQWSRANPKNTKGARSSRPGKLDAVPSPPRSRRRHGFIARRGSASVVSVPSSRVATHAARAAAPLYQFLSASGRPFAILFSP